MLAAIEEHTHEVARRSGRKAPLCVSGAKVPQAFVEALLPRQQERELLMSYSREGVDLKGFAQARLGARQIAPGKQAVCCVKQFTNTLRTQRRTHAARYAPKKSG